MRSTLTLLIVASVRDNEISQRASAVRAMSILRDRRAHGGDDARCSGSVHSAGDHGGHSVVSGALSYLSCINYEASIVNGLCDVFSQCTL